MFARLLVPLLGVLALAACDGGRTLGQFTSKALLLRALDPGAPSYEALLQYDLSADGCGQLGSARLTVGGRQQTLLHPGGPEGGDIASCEWPRWALEPGAAGEPFTSLRLEDGSGRVQGVVQNAYAVRTVQLTSGEVGQTGQWVEFEFQPPTDTLSEVEVSFLAQGAVPGQKVVWFNKVAGQAEFEKNKVRVAIPARQPPGQGEVSFSAVPQPGIYACEGLTSCRVEGLSLAGSVPFAIAP